MTCYVASFPIYLPNLPTLLHAHTGSMGIFTEQPTLLCTVFLVEETIKRSSKLIKPKTFFFYIYSITLNDAIIFKQTVKKLHYPWDIQHIWLHHY